MKSEANAAILCAFVQFYIFNKIFQNNLVAINMDYRVFENVEAVEKQIT